MVLVDPRKKRGNVWENMEKRDAKSKDAKNSKVAKRSCSYKSFDISDDS